MSRAMTVAGNAGINRDDVKDVKSELSKGGNSYGRHSGGNDVTERIRADARLDVLKDWKGERGNQTGGRGARKAGVAG